MQSNTARTKMVGHHLSTFVYVYRTLLINILIIQEDLVIGIAYTPDDKVFSLAV